MYFFESAALHFVCAKRVAFFWTGDSRRTNNFRWTCFKFKFFTPVDLQVLVAICLNRAFRSQARVTEGYFVQITGLV